MGQSGGDMKKIAGADGCGGLTALAPLHEGLAFKNVDNRFLCTVMMDAGLRSGLDEKRAAPHAGGNAQITADGGVALRAWRLRCTGAELLGANYADAGCLAHMH